MDFLATYLFAAMVSWTHVPAACDTEVEVRQCSAWERWHQGETPETSRARYQMIAEDIVNAGALPGEALMLTSLAFNESGFALDVDDFQCNPPYPKRGHWCDGGVAYSIFQYHLNGRKVPKNRAEAAVAALEIYRLNPRAWSTWKRARALADRWVYFHPELGMGVTAMQP